MDSNIQNLLEKKRHDSHLEGSLSEGDLTGDILRRFNLDEADPEALYYVNGNIPYKCYECIRYKLSDGVHFCRLFGMHYIEVKLNRVQPNHVFVIKEIDNREVNMEKQIIESYETDGGFVSYVKFNGDKFEIDVGNGNQKCNIGKLREIFQRFVKVDDAENNNDIKLKEEEKGKSKKGIKSKRVKSDGFNEKEDQNCFDHNIAIDEDYI